MYNRRHTSVFRGGARGACTPLSFRTPLFFSHPPARGGAKKIGGSPLLFCCPLVFQILVQPCMIVDVNVELKMHCLNNLRDF